MRPRTARRLAGALSVLGAVVVWAVATQLFPYHSLNHDEAVYLQQAALLLDGQFSLWPPVEDLMRPWFFVADGERLYPKYAPVPAAVFALGKLVGAPRLSLAAVAGGILALTYGVSAAAFDRRTGLVAAGFVLASPLFVLDAATFLPYAPTHLLNLAFAFAYLRADRTGDRQWAAAAGAAAGLAFFARPYTAVLFAAPFLVHAAWTLRVDVRAALPRQAVTAAFGLGGVALALGYNAAVTGSPWLFPYQAFAPLDGLGFGRRRILGHEVVYTLDLALRANREVVALLFTEWVAGGLLGTGLAAFGLGVAARRGLTARQAVVAGLFVSVVAGNVYFWGNYNLLGDLDRAGDGLVAALGPYYHFDLLLPTAAFAARGALAAVDRLRAAAGDRLDPERRRVAVAAVLLLSAAVFGAVTAGAAADPVAENAEVTATYERAYAPFESGPPPDSLVLLPDPYGDWLNHPFQALRNDPGFDGEVVYAVDDRPFAVAAAFPDRTLYRYGYRGQWAPFDGSPTAARLQRVHRASGRRVGVAADLGVPAGAQSVTVRVATDDGSAYYVAGAPGDTVALRLAVADGHVDVTGDVRAAGDPTLRVAGRDTVRVTAFVDYRGGGGFSYRLDLPVDAGDETVRALSPRQEWCRDARACGGAATYVPATAPDAVAIRTTLFSGNASPKFRSA